MKIMSGSDNDDFGVVLSSAALFETTFSIDWIIKLCEKKASQILEYLERAIEEGWLRKGKHGYFNFVNEKTRIKWQQNVSDEDKGHLHQKISDVLLSELPDGDDKVRSIAHHLLFVTNDLDRCRWLTKAADAYKKAFYFTEALKYYKKVLEDLSNTPGSEADELFIDTSIKYSKIANAQFDIKKVLAVLKQSILRAKKIKDNNSLTLLHMHVAKNEWLRSNYKQATTAFKKGILLSKEVDDPAVLRSVVVFNTFFHYWQGRFTDAVDIYQNSLPEFDQYPEGIFNYYVAITVGYCYAMFGQISQAIGMTDAIRSEYRQMGHTQPGALGSAMMAAIMLDIKRPDEAFCFLKETDDMVKQGGHKLLAVFVSLIQAYAYYLKGNSKRTVSYLEKFLKLSRESQATAWPYPYLFELCWGIAQGTLPSVHNLSLEDEIAKAKKSKNIFMIGLAFRYQALLQQKEEQPVAHRLRTLTKSEKFLEISGNQLELARTRQEIMRHHLLAGDKKGAKKVKALAAKPFSKISTDMLPEDLKPLIKNTFAEKNIIEEIILLEQKATTVRSNEDFLHAILVAANRSIGAERGAIYVLEEDNKNSSLSLIASRNLTAKQIAQMTVSSSMNYIKKVIESGKAVIHSPKNEKNENLSDFVRSLICTPLIYKRKILGVIYHDNRLINNAFSEKDLQILKIFSTVAATVADNHMIQRELYQYVDGKLFMDETESENPFLTSIVGDSSAIKQVLSTVEQVAQTESTVLILGETGVGKELVAKAIHRNSRRSDKPFISVNCSALPENLIESELFGHERGAFTGAHQKRAGRFELANGGTLFLDEIGELSSETQVRLLRVIQTKEFERIGGSLTLQSDFRLIVATNRNLEEEIKAGRFREDLFYRLNIFPIFVPPLRERKEDIPLLARHFLKRYSKKMDRHFDNFPTNEMDKLVQYDWPGNVRELENIIERGTVLNSSTIFLVPNLEPGYNYLTSPETNSNISLRENEKRHILQILQKTDWKVRGPGGAAELLEIHPSTLNSRIKKLEIERPEAKKRNRPAVSETL